jgi:hypothetical protein
MKLIVKNDDYANTDRFNFKIVFLDVVLIVNLIKVSKRCIINEKGRNRWWRE